MVRILHSCLDKNLRSSKFAYVLTRKLRGTKGFLKYLLPLLGTWGEMGKMSFFWCERLALEEKLEVQDDN
jgi:hypothetical protein